ncbi:hypothetical protein ACTOB_004768 [Actinoplanes oblitus]|uniref:Two pore domain potassium channel family protein n=1 Tax=Actinoplanes oblitus TaxID=3040509 RepID=A0ABY8W782_9ACTN|nr:hypothetical protein [Actinoplanes oblitus]WIM92810.1 hypothetical protein ACTOB_004768 [Actinoplanes oblitus]
MQAVRWLGCLAGLVLLAGTSLSVLHTVAGPRGRTSRLAAHLGRSVERAGRFGARRLRSRRARDRLLVLVGPTAFLVVLFAWLACYVVGYGLIGWPLLHNLAWAMRLAGSSVFTLGFAVPAGAGQTVLAFVAASTGLVVVTLELAYLPSLYAAYNRREAAVTQLAARCTGSVNGVHLLLTHLRQDWADGLTALFAAWELWAADVRETHTNYPILISFRASDPAASWPFALLAVLDAAALQLLLTPGERAPQARATLRIGIATLQSVAPRDVPDSGIADIDLDAVLRELRDAGCPVPADPSACARRLREYRSRYAPAVSALADLLLLDPPGAADDSQ